MSIKSDTITIKGKLSFMHFTSPDDAFKGTPKYKFRLTNLSDAAVNAIIDRFGDDAGMGHKRIKFDEKYPDSGQYTGFSSAFPIKVKYEGRDIIVGGRDEDGNDVVKILDPIANAIGYGSEAVVKVFADAQGTPRVSFVDIIDLKTFEAEDDSYDADEVL